MDYPYYLVLKKYQSTEEIVRSKVVRDVETGLDIVCLKVFETRLTLFDLNFFCK